MSVPVAFLALNWYNRYYIKDGGGSMEEKRQYISIDLKSFYASVECRERKLDPMTS